jgi:hypothetical protein
MDFRSRSIPATGDRIIQELADEIAEPVEQWREVASWRVRALAALNRVTGSNSPWSLKFEALVDDLALPAPSLAEEWDVHEYEQRFHEAIGVLVGAAEEVRTAARHGAGSDDPLQRGGASPMDGDGGASSSTDTGQANGKGGRPVGVPSLTITRGRA